MSNPDYYNENLRIIGIRVSELKALTAERDRYREALDHIIAYHGNSKNYCTVYEALDHIMDLVKAALAGKE